MEKFTLKCHCALGFLLRFLLIVYSTYHDKFFSVPYTDIDYKVFTDAARYMLDGCSPFKRHTYRYSPLLALLLTPNILCSSLYGKVFFSFIDILVAMLISKLILMNKNNDVNIAIKCACLWLYNPLTIVISTRGNADCLAAFLVILSLCFLQSGYFSLAGLIHGASIHFRLYPLLLSMAIYFSLRMPKSFFVNMNQFKFTFACIISLTTLTAVSYYFYGYKFLHESLIYHLIRKDTRHNFSIFFYPLYLSVSNSLFQNFRIFNVVPQFLLLVSTSTFYSSKNNLPFALMIQVFIFVTYNTVITSQYFFWFLCLFPLSSQQLDYNLPKFLKLFGIWISSQCMWLAMAYSLEYRSINTFNFIWLASILFFVINIKILIYVLKIFRKE